MLDHEKNVFEKEKILIIHKLKLTGHSFPDLIKQITKLYAYCVFTEASTVL